MQKKQMFFKTRGMNRDLSVSAFNPEFCFENMNLRLSTSEHNTLMSWVNERGTLPVTLYTSSGGTSAIEGIALGVCVLNHTIVLFTCKSAGMYPDHIYALRSHGSSPDSLSLNCVYAGFLGFDSSHPLETLASYESDLVQKVYWTDGCTQPKVINIVGRIKESPVGVIDSQFDFLPELQLREEVHVRKVIGGGGLFAPGVIQYAFTYYNLYGQETNIFHTTPLYYISFSGRGASPEDKVDNCFHITVSGVDSSHFDYLRIYSIHRTSLNGTPICRRVQDIRLDGLSSIHYIDTGTSGDSVDPMELLYKGGEEVSVQTLEQKDGTLFMGNLSIIRPLLSTASTDNVDIVSSIPSKIDISCSYRHIYCPLNTSNDYVYFNQLTSYSDPSHSSSVPCGGFKSGNTYRLGVQFQYKTGMWSDPLFIGDYPQLYHPLNGDSSGEILLPIFQGKLPKGIGESLFNMGYRRLRPVVVLPDPQDRVVVCQTVAAPTMFTDQHSDSLKDGDLHGQSSWFFRTKVSNGIYENFSKGTSSPCFTDPIPYTSNALDYDPSLIRNVEVQGEFSVDNMFRVQETLLTLHSPDVEFDDTIFNSDLTGSSYRQVGYATVSTTFSDIDIQTSSPTISNYGDGFIHKSFIDSGMRGIVAGLFYDDFIVDEVDDGFKRFGDEKSSVKWMVYPWHKSGSLNNDVKRPADAGSATAVLEKKVISNLRFSTTSYEDNPPKPSLFSVPPQVFNSDEVSILKIGDQVYMGNIDTLLMPDGSDGLYFAINGTVTDADVVTPFTSPVHWKTYSTNDDQPENYGLWKYNGGWSKNRGNIGNDYVDLVVKREPVRMRYKSTPHIVGDFSSSTLSWEDSSSEVLPVVDIVRDVTPYRDSNPDTLREHYWLPCGDSVRLDLPDEDGNIVFDYSYGDTYFQRYDCLKTYAFSPDDINQVVEIGSFMLETYVNIDGRYDRNRGQINNLNASPRNFNLLNPVYSQRDNFFSYRIMPDDFYKNRVFPNQITWSKSKQNGANVDLWTNVTLASTLEMDGNKGCVVSLQRLNDQLLCFQDQGISQILYNETTQISTTEGVPIEIANSGKVQGKRYLSNTVGCSNKWSIVSSPSGLYFMDSHEKSIYRLGDGLQNLSHQGGFDSWCKQHIPSSGVTWTPVDFDNFVGYYDRKNQDVLYINKEIALAYSEKFGVFTSFYDYGNSPFFCNFDDRGVWFRQGVSGRYEAWFHQLGSYGVFFGYSRPYSMTLVCNPDPLFDKVFCNLEFRSTVDTSVVSAAPSSPSFPSSSFDSSFDSSFRKLSSASVPSGLSSLLPFDMVEAWNDYQHGYSLLHAHHGRNPFRHHLSDGTSSLLRKFRIWRCDLPRDNAPLSGSSLSGVSDDSLLGISRLSPHPLDRLRNPWLYVKLLKFPSSSLPRVEVHDMVVDYYL